MGVAQRPKALDRSVLGAGAVIAVFLILHHYWAYLTAPGTHDLTAAQRVAAIKSALKHGDVAALREGGEMALVSRENIAHIGNSQCIGEPECYRIQRSRRGPDRCTKVQINLYCAFEIVDTKGDTAAAIVKTFRSDFHTPPELSSDDPEWRYETMMTERPDAPTAKTKLCQIGYCLPGVLSRWKPPPRVQPPDPYKEAREQCNGVLANIVGKGTTCLDPSDPKAREFRDCKDGFCAPTMVALTNGRYKRGTSEAEIASLRRDFSDHTQLGKDEHPERDVAIGYFAAVGKFEVTFDEWDACLADDRCTPPDDEGWGRGKRPVINVSWDDITREYLPWLNEKLGLSGVNGYRLLTDGEWEYAARAGTTSRYAFGNTISRSDAQFFDGPIGAPLGNTAETGSFAPNAFGLHDMHGNVAEWVQDCFSFMNDAADLPTDGSALDKNKWISSDGCRYRAFRGGSFASGSHSVRAATRGSNAADARHKSVGFRLARTLWLKPEP